MKKIALALLLLASPVFSQRPALNSPVIRFSDSNGKPLAFGTLQSYQAGTTTPLATFVDSTTGAVNANPVVLDSTGSATVFLGPNVYKLVLKNSAGVVQWTADNIAEGAFQSSYVKSFNGRTGVVVPATGDYTCAQVTGCPTLPTPPTLYYQTVQVSGSSEPQEVRLNFIPGISGSVGSPTVTAGGSGYTGAPTVNFMGGSCVVEPTGSSTVSGGAVTALVLVTTGSGCTSAPSVAFSGGGGTGAAATVVVIPDGITCIDNPGAGSTDCMFTFGSGGGGSAIAVADVTGSRSFTTVFTNTTTSALYVSGYANTASGGSLGTITCNIGPTTGLGEKVWSQINTATNVPGDIGFTCMVPASYSYQITTSGAIGTLAKWFEYTGFGGGGGGGGSGCTPAGATNSLQKNAGGGNCAASSAIDNGSTFAIGEPTTAPAVNTVINAGSSLSAAVTACGSANTTIQITQTIAVGSGITVPANCTLLFQSAGNLTGTSITINGAVQSSPHQIFGSGLAVTLGSITSKVPIEWFGGKGDATGSVGVGTDNLAPFNAAHTALTAGCIDFGIGGYRFSGVATVTKVNMCVEGQTFGYPATAGGISANSSNLWIDTAGSDGLFYTSTASWGIIRNLAVLRTQTPTGTAMGIRIEAFGATLENLISQDSIYDTYFHGASNANITNVDVGWGFTGMAGTPSPNVCGFFIDSSGGVGSASIKFFNDNTSSNLSGAGNTSGICASGTNVSDIYTSRFETSSLNHGIDVESTGTLNGTSQDIRFVDSILNACINDCVKINGVGATADIGPHVYITGGNFFATGSSAVGALIENSSNVSMTGVQVFSGSASVQTDISLSSVDGFQINDNQMDGESLVNISCLNSTHGTINSNQIKTTGTATGIKNVGCTDVSEQGNSIAGNVPGVLTTGMSFDSGSSNNGPWSLNNIDSATVTTPVSDAGTNNNTLKPTILVLANGTPLTGQSSAQSQIVTCPTGGTGSQFCGADGAWHSASGAGTVTSVGTSSPLSGGPITTSGTLSCPTCVTSAASLTANALMLGASGQASAALGSLGTTVTVLHGNAAGAPTFGAVGLTTDVTGILPVPNGGSGAGTFTIHGVLLGQTAGTFHATAAGASNAVFMGQGAADPIFVAQPVIDCTNCTNLPSGGILGMTTGQVAIAGSATTITSSKALAGAGAGITTGPASGVTSGDLASLTGTGGQIADSSIIASQVATENPAIVPTNTLVMTGGSGSGKNLIATAWTDSLTATAYTGSGGITSASFTGALNSCSDTSGSGTAQTCTLATTYVLVKNACFAYTTTTTNSGAGLTLNVNSTGVKSIAIAGGSGWTTTLTAGIIPANVSLWACYDGTNLDVQQTGTAASGGTVTWNAIGTPTGSLSLPFPNADTTTLTAGSATSTANFFTLADTNGNTGTGDLLMVQTGTTSTMIPFEVLAKTVSAFKVLADGEVGIFGKGFVNATSNVQGTGFYVGAAGLYAIGGSTLKNSAVGNTQVLSLQNGTTPANGTSVSEAFQAINSVSTFKSAGVITGTLVSDTSTAETGSLSFSIINAGAQVTALTLSGAGNAAIPGTASANHFSGLGTAPTIVAGTGAGGSPTLTATLDTDLSGYVQVLTGTAPVLSASVFTVTFGTPYTTAPKCILLPDNAVTQALTGIAAVQIFDPSTTVATATSGATALVTATTYKWSYTCTQ